MDAIQRELLMQVAGLHEIPAGAYNIRSNGQSIERKSTGNIEIINKPDKSGIELVQEFRQHPASEVNSIPIIMITVDTKEKTVLDAKNLGIREYLVKPISPIALKKRICNVFGIKERV